MSSAPDDPNRTGAHAPVPSVTAAHEPEPARARAGPLPEIPGYEIQGVLGRGGMGVVFRAVQVKAKRPVALKMVLSGALAGDSDRERFRVEAEAVARLRHPNIVQVYDVGEHGGAPYFALEFCDGGTLAARLGGTPLTAAATADLVEQLADAMHHAHDAGIVHRDLKPANILLTKSAGRAPEGDARRDASVRSTRRGGSGSRGTSTGSARGEPGLESAFDSSAFLAKVTDFGLAKQLEGDSAHTGTGVVMGTPSYMSPEQAFGESKRVTRSADVYALGAILYECLTGRPPFKGATAAETLDQVRNREPAPPTALNPSAPRDLETICLKCLQKEPEKRYATAGELADDLRRYQDGRPIRARPVGAVERFRKLVRRYPLVTGLIAAVIGTVLLGSVGITLALFQAEQKAADERQARVDEEEQRIRAVEQEGFARESEKKARYQEGLANDNANRAEKNADEAKKNATEAATQAGKAKEGEQKSERSRLLLLVQQALASLSAGDPSSADTKLDQCPDEYRSWDFWHVRHMRSPDLVPWMGEGRPAASAAFAPDGRWIAISYRDGTVGLWDLATRLPGARWKAFAREGGRIAFNGDGSGLFVLGGAERGAALKAFTRDGRETHTVPLSDPALIATPMSPLVLTPDGRSVCVGLYAPTIAVFDARAPKEPRIIALPALHAPTSLTFGSNRFFAGTTQGVVEVDFESGRVMSVDREHATAVRCVGWSNEFSCLVSGGDDDRVRVRVSNERVTFKGHTGPVTDLATTADGKYAVSGGADGTIRLWRLGIRLEAFRLPGAGVPVRQLALSPHTNTAGATLLLCVWEDGSVRLVDALGGPGGRFLGTHEWRIQAMAFDPTEGRLLVSGDFDGVVRFWDPDVGQYLGGGRAHQGPRPTRAVTALAFSPDGKWVVSAGRDGRVLVWDVAERKPVREFPRQRMLPVALAFAPDGTRLAVGELGGAVALWDFARGERIGTLLTEGGSNSLSWSRRNLLAAAGDRSVTVLDMNRAENRVIFERTELGPPIQSVGFHPDKAELAVLHVPAPGHGLRNVGPGAFEDGGGLRVWDVGTGREVANKRALVERMAYTADGKRLIAIGRYETKVWETESWQEALSLPGSGDGVDALAVAPDRGPVPGRVAFGTSNPFLEAERWSTIPGEVRLWEAPNEPPSRSFRRHTDAVMWVRFDPAGRRLYSAAEDGVRTWEVASGQQTSELTVPNTALPAISFSQSQNQFPTPPVDRDPVTGRFAVALTTRAGTPESVVRVTDATGHEVWRTSARDLTSGGLAFRPGGNQLLVVAWDAGFPFKAAAEFTRAELRDAATGTVVRAFALPADAPKRDSRWTAAAWSPAGDRLALELSRGLGVSVATIVFDPDTGTELYRLPGHARARYTSDGKHLVALDRDVGRQTQTVRVLDAATGRPERELCRIENDRAVGALAVEPNDRLVAVGIGGVVTVWDRKEGRAVAEIREPRLPRPANPSGEREYKSLDVKSLAFAADGRLAAGYSNGLVKVYELPLVWDGEVRVKVAAGLAPYLAFRADEQLAEAVACGYAGLTDRAAAAFGSAAALLEPVARDHPSVARYPLLLAVVYRKAAEFERSAGRVAGAEIWDQKLAALPAPARALRPPTVTPEFAAKLVMSRAEEAFRQNDKATAAALAAAAVKLFGEVRKGQPPNAPATDLLGATVLAARCRYDLKEYAAAVKGWDAALALSPNDVTLRLNRAMALVRAGNHVRAAAEAEAIRTNPQLGPVQVMALVRIHALCATAAADDPALGFFESVGRCRSEIVRAMRDLEQFRQKGWFNNELALDRLNADPTLAPLRATEDFRVFIAGLPPAKK